MNPKPTGDQTSEDSERLPLGIREVAEAISDLVRAAGEGKPPRLLGEYIAEKRAKRKNVPPEEADPC